MSETVMLIRKEDGFIINTVRHALEKSSYKVLETGFDPDEIKNAKDSAGVMLLYVTGDVESDAEALVYIRDLCLEGNRQLIVIGNSNEFEALNKFISPEIIAHNIERPINMEKLCENVAEMFEERTMQAMKKCVLIVDDDAVYLRAVRNCLKDEYRVGMATSGMQAITWLAQNSADMILLDYEMPVMSGPKVLDMLRSEERTKNIPVIFLTGKSDKLSILRAISLKPDGYILKSEGLGEVIRTLKDFFADPAFQDESDE